ncbi:MAG: hypothetical protein LBG89_01755 [Rickettsiales bacterium]|nr:hypothetical protein [Rickettsiales bacterium]
MSLIVALASAAVVLSAEIYVASKKSEVAPVVFQTSNYAEGRADVVAFEELFDEEIIDWMLRRWVFEAYHANPDAAEARVRGSAGRDSFIYFMSASETDVFETWKREVYPEIEDIAAKKGMREVRVRGIAKEGEYYRVDLRLDTWAGPRARTHADRTIYLKVDFERELRPNAARILRDGGDASKIFRFRVVDFRG